VRSIPRTRYWYSAERHPGLAPWRGRRAAWRRRGDRVSLIPVAPWPPGWLTDALCVHHYEGAWNAPSGIGPEVSGGMQIGHYEWLEFGGGRWAYQAYLTTPRHQLLVAYRYWRVAGWNPWPNTARQCGLL